MRQTNQIFVFILILSFLKLIDDSLIHSINFNPRQKTPNSAKNSNKNQKNVEIRSRANFFNNSRKNRSGRKKKSSNGGNEDLVYKTKLTPTFCTQFQASLDSHKVLPPCKNETIFTDSEEKMLQIF